MAPIRRYLRITKYSVLECRIYLDNPALAQTWLLNPRKPILPRVIESVRPLVLPKLREERERSRKRSTKKKAIKDVVVEDDFEVSIFLTETSTRHSLLTKHKHFHDTTQTKLTSNTRGGSLVGAASEAPIDVEEENADPAVVAGILRREESDEENVGAVLAAIPAAVVEVDVDIDIDQNDNLENDTPTTTADRRRPPKRARRSSTSRNNTTAAAAAGTSEEDPPESDVEAILSDLESEEEHGLDEDDGLFVDNDEDGGDWGDGNMGPPPAKKRRRGGAALTADSIAETSDDKKKLAMDISYEGFSIYGRVLCLVVKQRRGGGDGSSSSSISSGATGAGMPTPITASSAAGGGGGGRDGSTSTKMGMGMGGRGQAMMENFIISTQVPAGMTEN